MLLSKNLDEEDESETEPECEIGIRKPSPTQSCLPPRNSVACKIEITQITSDMVSCGCVWILDFIRGII